MNDFGPREGAWLVDRKGQHAIEIQLAEVRGMAGADVRLRACGASARQFLLGSGAPARQVRASLPLRRVALDRHAFKNSL